MVCLLSIYLVNVTLATYPAIRNITRSGSLAIVNKNSAMAGPKAMNVHPKNTDAVILGLGPNSTQVSLLTKPPPQGPSSLQWLKECIFPRAWMLLYNWSKPEAIYIISLLCILLWVPWCYSITSCSKCLQARDRRSKDIRRQNVPA